LELEGSRQLLLRGLASSRYLGTRPDAGAPLGN
jgi:hypothetical protein